MGVHPRRWGLVAIVVLGHAGLAMAQWPQPLRIRVEVDDELLAKSPGLLRHGEKTTALEDELSAALSDGIRNSGRWSRFCWLLVPKADSVNAELRVLLSLVGSGSWEMQVSLVTAQPLNTETLATNTIVLRSDDLQAEGHPARGELPKKLVAWFTSHYLNSPQRETVHAQLSRLVPVGRGEVSVVAHGNEKLSTLYLPLGFEHFRDSEFAFVCRKNGMRIPFKVRGTGVVQIPTPSEIQLHVRPDSDLPPNLQGGDPATAYLVRFVDESDLGGVPIF